MKKLLSFLLILTISVAFSSYTLANTYLGASEDNGINWATVGNALGPVQDMIDNGVQHDANPTTIDQDSKYKIELTHSNAAVIGFEVKHASAAGKLDAEPTVIAAFHVKNNTIDGFAVTLTSANGGKLLPVAGGNFHGETSIDYTLDIEKGPSAMLSGEGSIEGENVNTQGLGHFNITDKSARTLINGQSQGSPTDSTYVISIELDDESTDSGYGLAGIYKEALLLTYTDF
jgi:hypothetical protein